MKKILVFDIWADYAHFKKPYTTTSPVTYSIPSRTSITGMIGAILGIEKNKTNTELSSDKISIALGIKKQIKKVMIGHNLIDTKTAKYMAWIKQRTQIKFEYVKEPKYRIYVSEGLHYENLKEKLENHESHYTLSLGLSECIANYEYIGEFEGITKNGDCHLDSVAALDFLKPEQIELSKDLELFSDRFAMDMKEDREVTRYSDVIFERKGNKIHLKNADYIQVSNGENIIFL